MLRRAALALLLSACPAATRTAAPLPPPPPRPSVEECKAASDHVVELSLAAFDDDPVFVAEIMGEVRERPPEARDLRCHEEATPEQVACLAGLDAVDGITACAPEVVACVRGEDADACERMKAAWGWGVELLTSALKG